MKVNPLLEKKVFGFTVNELIGFLCGAICATAEDSTFAIQSRWLNFIAYIGTWILGFFLWTVIISLIKTFITKED